MKVTLKKSTPASDVVRAYHLMSADHALKSIERRRLKVARISEVNDPFELFALQCLKRPVRKVLKHFKASHDSEVGLLCFSKRWKNPVLWSHYADRHRGICLGFDIDRQIGVRGLMEVQYEPNKLRLDSDETPDPKSIPEDIQELLFVTKFEHWRYEEELRVVVKLARATKVKEMYFWPFSQGLRLREVILGHACPATVLKEARKLVRESGADALVSKGRLGFKYFEVKVDGRYPPE